MTAPTISQSGRRAVTLTGIEVRKRGDGGVVVRGHAAVFDSPTMIGPAVGGFEEVVAPGAFAKTLADGADVRFLFNHNPDLILARTKSGTLTLREDRVGLAVEAQLAPTSVGRDLAILLERGDVSQMSFGFRVVKDKWETVNRSDGAAVERRTVLEAQLLDVSGVTYPAYDETDLALREATLARELRDARNPKTSEEPAPATPPDPPQGDTSTTDPGQSGVASSQPPEPTPVTPALDEPTPTPEQRSTSVSNTLIDERARIWHKMKELRSETRGRVMSGEEEKSWQQMEGDLDRVERSIAIQEQGDKYERMYEAAGDAPVSTRGADNAAHPATPPIGGSAGRAIDAAGSAATPGDIQRSYDYDRAFVDYLRRGVDGMRSENRDLLERENRDQSVGTNTAGGYTVPPGFVNKITEAMKAWGSMLDAANVIETDSGQALQWPTVDDTGNTGAILTENNAVTALDVTFGTKTLSSFMYTSRLVKVSLQLLQDSAFNLDDFLGRIFARRIGTAINAHFTNGTGGGTQPAGMVPNLTVGKQGAVGSTTSLGAGGATNVAYLETVDIEHSVDPAYRANAKWMMADSSVKVFRRILDADGRPVWQPSLQLGVPSTINGYPVIVNQDMPVMAASARSIAFGDFKQAYTIRRARGMQTLRMNERFADALQVGFLAFARYDGVVDDASAAKVFQNSAT